MLVMMAPRLSRLSGRVGTYKKSTLQIILRLLVVPKCNHCLDFGYVQIYSAGVTRVYCDCEAGTKRIEQVKEALRAVGANPEDPKFGKWSRRSDFILFNA